MGPAGASLVEFEFEEEGDVAFVGFGVGTEVGVEGALGLGLEETDFGDGGVGRQLDFGGNRRRGGHGIQVPALVDAAGHAEQHLGARGCGGGLHAEFPGDVLVLGEEAAGQKQSKNCRLHVKSGVC